MASNAVDVYVKMPTGKSDVYLLTPCQCIKDLRDMVAEREKVASNQVRFKYHGKVLYMNKTIQEYGVRSETILKVELLVPRAIVVKLELPDGEEVIMEKCNLASVSELFDTASEKMDVSTDQVALEHGKKALTSQSTSLLDAGIGTESTIKASIKIKPTSASHSTDVGEDESRKKSAKLKVRTDLDQADREAILSSFQTDGRRVDVVFSFDTTGSMYSYLTEVRDKIKSCCARLMKDIPGIRIGLVAHGDYCDESGSYVIRSLDLSDNVDELQNFAQTVPKTSGGDLPECYEWVLHKAQNMDWSEDSAKALVIIGDAVPHPPSYTDQRIIWREELNILKGMGIKVYGVQAGNITDADKFYAEISDQTGGKHLSLQHFDIITDMFLAVCYSEGSEELLEGFEQELQTTGHMTQEKKEMFSQLKEKKDEKAVEAASSQRYVAAEWWDHSLEESTTFEYFYDVEKNIWNNNTMEYNRSVRARLDTATTTVRKEKSKTRCSIM